jgi:anaerobic ribonucleoside-triphosphate reductase activating protein
MLTNIFIQYPVLEGVTISGGEPFRQATELAELVRFIRRKIHADILVYSGFSIEELEAMGGSARAVLRSVSALVEGRYVEELNDNLPLRGSANQRILVFNQKYEARYGTLQKVQRRVQNVFCGNGAISFGIPLKGYRESISDGLIKRGIITNGA